MKIIKEEEGYIEKGKEMEKGRNIISQLIE